jgi:hypothetical protein
MDPDPEGPKTRGFGGSGSGFGTGSTTLADTVIVLFRDQWKKEKRQRLAAARESALSNEQAMIESRFGQSVNQTFLYITINWGLKPGFRIRIDLMRIRIPDPDSGSGFWIRIPDPDPGFDDLKLKKNYS